MSLVNYCSSSDDESSNGEEKTEEKSKVELRSVKAHKQPSATATASAMSSEYSEARPRPKAALFSTLPAPKSSEIDVPGEPDSLPSSASGTTSSAAGGLLNLPAPKRKSAQLIKITAPSLSETFSDDEEEEPVAKKTKPAKTKRNLGRHSLGSPVKTAVASHTISGQNHLAGGDQSGLAGLFAMLPKPRNASLKETNRILLPHTLTKRPAPSSNTTHKPAGKVKSPQQATAKTTPLGLATTYGSDEEDDKDTTTASFFSFGESSKAALSPPSTAVTQSASFHNKPNLTSVSAGPVVTKQAFHQTPPLASTSKEPTNPGGLPKLDSTAPLKFGPSVSEDTPLAFKPTNPPMGQDVPLAFSKPMAASSQYGYPSQSEPQTYQMPYGYGYTEYNQPYQEQDPSVYGQVEAVASEGAQSAGSSTDLAADKEFQRLMGKRNIGRESINITDIAADEVIGPTNHLDWMKKNLSEEKEYRAKLRKEQLPSGQQRRKHQITYLAHQAKERELELKNQWANNRQTRKDTQMKYGF